MLIPVTTELNIFYRRICARLNENKSYEYNENNGSFNGFFLWYILFRGCYVRVILMTASPFIPFFVCRNSISTWLIGAIWFIEGGMNTVVVQSMVLRKGEEIRWRPTLMALNLAGSLSANCLRTCLAANPKEHRPCRMGSLKPDQRAYFNTERSSINEIKTSFALKSQGKKMEGKKAAFGERGSEWLTSHRSKAWVYMKRVPVSAQTIQRSLVPQRNTDCLDVYIIHKLLNLPDTHGKELKYHEGDTERHLK